MTEIERPAPSEATPRTGNLKIPSEAMLLIGQDGVLGKVVQAILTLGDHARQLEKELNVWEWVKESARTNADHAVLVKMNPDGNLSFLHGDPSTPSEIPRSLQASLALDEVHSLEKWLTANGHHVEGPAMLSLKRIRAALKAPSTNAAPQGVVAPADARTHSGDSATAVAAPSSGSVVVPMEAWKLALSALHEAEAILGGEYGDTYAILCETMCKLEAQLAAAPQPATGLNYQVLFDMIDARLPGNPRDAIRKLCNAIIANSATVAQNERGGA